MQLYPYYPSHPLFTRIFDVARELWPTKTLSYVGNEQGTIFMQEHGNAEPFVFHERRLNTEGCVDQQPPSPSEPSWVPGEGTTVRPGEKILRTTYEPTEVDEAPSDG